MAVGRLLLESQILKIFFFTDKTVSITTLSISSLWQNIAVYLLYINVKCLKVKLHHNSGSNLDLSTSSVKGTIGYLSPSPEVKDYLVTFTRKKVSEFHKPFWVLGITYLTL